MSSKKIAPPKIGDVYQDRSYSPGGRVVRVIQEVKDWRGRPAYVVEVVHHIFPDVIGRKTTVGAEGLRSKYRKEASA